MGMDINVVLEKYNKDAQEWESLHLYKKDKNGEFKPLPVYEGRNQDLFGILANSGNMFIYPPVNNGSLVPLRGLPNNISAYAKEWYDGGSGWFNETWYDYTELDSYTNILVDMNKLLKSKDKEIKELEKKIEELKRDEEDWEFVEYLDDEDEDNE